ncbi:Threonine dehydrogenase and related Zn-dependent dehydrogenases [hydrothermal vent metagenome]|uniref:Threonine dehydrogenase and related Zn-dependent dehydrogenases n=1 Tax=hydrothermal vent metagenome TaxID=652676 RepID=A0A3B0VXF7_9ZZZZ
MQRQALYFTAPFSLEIRDEPLPPLPADGLLVQTILSAISPGTEMLLYRGQMPSEMMDDATIDALAEGGYPQKFGYAAVGRVVEVGQTVDKAWCDRLVFAFQPHQSHFVAKTDELLPLPVGMLPETAVFLPNMETAVSFIIDGQPSIGEQVAVFGQGIVGLLTTCLLAQLPLASLLTLDSYSLRRDWSLKLGAAVSLDPLDPDLPAKIQAALPHASHYPGIDLAFELSGNPAALDMAVGLMGFNGRILIGSWYGNKRAELNLGGQFHRSQIQLLASQVSHIAPRWRGRWAKSRRMAVAWEMLQKHQPQQLISHRFPLAEAAKSYEIVDRRPETAVQIIFTYDE